MQLYPAATRREASGRKPWQMIVLDEAQAIKYASTKRFKAAIGLQGKVKIALTGTPIENHLEEIWSLFRFIAPGLLGSRESFQKRFLSPVATSNTTRTAVTSKNVVPIANIYTNINTNANANTNIHTNTNTSNITNSNTKNTPSTTRDQQELKRQGFKKLIQLFILRRTKNAVLQELPPRTEQTILVPMTPEESSFYEALRRQLITNLTNLQDTKIPRPA